MHAPACQIGLVALRVAFRATAELHENAANYLLNP